MEFVVTFLTFLSVYMSVWALLTITWQKSSYRERIAQTFPEGPFSAERRKRRKGREDFLRRSPLIKKRQDRIVFIISTIIACALALLWHLSSPNQFAIKFLTTFAVVQLLTKIWNVRQWKRYQLKIEEALPGTLDLLVVCVEAGMSVQSALVRVAEETAGNPLSEELRYTFHELNVGSPLNEAFQHLGQRTKVADIQALSTSITQADKLGIGLGETLRNQAKFLRENIRMRTREKIMKLPIKMIIPVVFFIMPAIFTVVAGPSLLQVSAGLFKPISAEDKLNSHELSEINQQEDGPFSSY